jgi:hypothetical protein
VHLSWKSIKDAKEYLLTIKNNENQKREFKLQTNDFFIPKINIGNYIWYIQSINEKNELSKKITPKKFTIAQLTDLKFINFKYLKWTKFLI